MPVEGEPFVKISLDPFHALVLKDFLEMLTLSVGVSEESLFCHSFLSCCSLVLLAVPLFFFSFMSKLKPLPVFGFLVMMIRRIYTQRDSNLFMCKC